MTDLVNIPIGDCLQVDVSVKTGALVLTATADLVKVLRALEAKVPNAFVDGGIEMLIAALQTVSAVKA
jgi:hypothetical protein